MSIRCDERIVCVKSESESESDGLITFRYEFRQCV